jgi:hypothetical protein
MLECDMMDIHQIQIRYENIIVKSFPINSSKLKPFRSFTRGYTGPIEAIRDHYTFSIDGLR